MEMVRRAQSGINKVTTASVEEYETENLAVTKSTLKRTTSKADLDNHDSKKKKKQKVDEETSLDSLGDVMAFGNTLKSRYGPESEENEEMKSELLVIYSYDKYSLL
jgi:hypothetical protein